MQQSRNKKSSSSIILKGIIYLAVQRVMQDFASILLRRLFVPTYTIIRMVHPYITNGLIFALDIIIISYIPVHVYKCMHADCAPCCIIGDCE